MTFATRGGRAAAALAFALLPAACLQTVSLDHPNGSGGGSGLAGLGGGGFAGGSGNGGLFGADGGGSNDGPTDHIRCSGGGTAPQLMGQREVATVIIALDRSSSMALHLGNSGSRFSVTHDALKDVLAFYGPALQFGYLEFPGNPMDGLCESGCCASVATPLVGAGRSRMEINRQLDACSNQSGQVGCYNTDLTPTVQAMSRISNVYGPSLSVDSTGVRYALLITDGEPTCLLPSSSPSDSACEQAETAFLNLSLAKFPVSTFVVAVGDLPGVPTNACLDRLALAGGFGRNVGPPYYYPAKTDDLVRLYLGNILDEVACHFDITDQNNFDHDRVEFDIGNDTVPPDPTKQNGWAFDEKSPGKPDYTRINLYGAACQRYVASAGSNNARLTLRACPAPH